MTDRIIIGQRIAELRKNKGLTQAELADRIGVSHQAVSQWERSETLPDILTLPALAEIFGARSRLITIWSWWTSSLPSKTTSQNASRL